MTSELITFNHLRCHSSSTALGTRTGYWKPTLRGTDETPQSLNEDQPFFTSVLTLLYNIYSIRTAKKLHLENWIWKFSNAVSCTSYIKYMVNRESEAMAHHNENIYSKQIFVWYNLVSFKLPYTRHHNPLLIRNRSWILTIHKDRIFWKNLLEKMFFTFKMWLKNIQTSGYNGAGTVHILASSFGM